MRRAALRRALWKVGNWSTRTGYQNELTSYDVELHEIEEIDVNRLEFHGLDVDVEEYFDEASSDGTFAITAMFQTRGDQVATMSDLVLDHMRMGTPREYFDLRRVPIDDSPRRYRFGQVLWEDAGPHARRWLATFVEETGENEQAATGNAPSLFQLLEPQRTNLEMMTLKHHAMLRRLPGELEGAGFLAPGALNDYLRLDGHEHRLLMVESSNVAQYMPE